MLCVYTAIRKSHGSDVSFQAVQLYLQLITAAFPISLEWLPIGMPGVLDPTTSLSLSLLTLDAPPGYETSFRK